MCVRDRRAGRGVGGCFDGRTDGPFILFSVLLVLELAAVAVVVLAAQVVPVIVGVLVSLSGLWPDGIPEPLPTF